MTASVELVNRLSVDDYAREAFCIDPDEKTGYAQGGVYAGQGNLYEAEGDKKISARARLVPVASGKVLVRWIRGAMLTKTWRDASAGSWWVTDNIADRIIDQTADKYGRRGDSSLVARYFGNVGYTWKGEADDRGPVGTYKNDMQAVVVCRVTLPIKVLIGVGRPVVNPTLVGGSVKRVPLDSEELQIVMLTTIRSPKEPSRGTFIGDQFLTPLFFGSSCEFTDWWMRAYIVNRRRMAQVIAARRR